jgi:hypothetical protein
MVLLIVVIFVVFFIIFISQPCISAARENFNNNLQSRSRYLALYDLYISTLKYFNWVDWYKTHDYLPPFVYKNGRYYFSETSPESDQYAFLVHNGVDSKLDTYQKKFMDSAIGSKIIASLDNSQNESGKY